MYRALQVARVVLLVAAGVYVGWGAILWWFQERLLFLPPGGIGRDALDQAAAEVGAKPVELRASDGTALYAWHRTARRNPPDRARLAVYFGGNAEVVSDALPLHRLLLQAGFDVLAVSYRGYPGSEGSPSEAGLGLDADAAWAWATGPGGYPPDRVVLYGRSLGGGVASLLAAGPANPAAMVLESTFSSVTEVAGARVARGYPVRWLLRNPFDSRARAPEFGVPVFVMHSTDDEVIPHALGGARLAEVIADAELHVVSGLGHNDPIPLHRPEVRDALLAFLDRAAPR
jgi:pimeloyl-ACP methyl ester carboxylesterase